MRNFLHKRPVTIAAAVLGITAVLAAAFFLQPGKSKAPAAVAAAIETTAPPAPQEQVTLPAFDMDAALQEKLAELTGTQTGPVTSETASARQAATSAAAQTTKEATTAQSAPGTTTSRAQTMRASTTAAATTTRPAFTWPTTASRATSASTASTTRTTTTTARTTTTTSTRAPQPPPAQLTCTVSIQCGTILDNMDKLKPAKAGVVPSNGIILQSRTVTFTEGESVFDVLKRVTQSEGIHLEFTNVPAYGSAYIEGIGNIYEFDCGQLSGWMYRVNGAFPNYGSGRYTLKEGDVVEWLYTCDLGKDIGGENATGQRG